MQLSEFVEYIKDLDIKLSNTQLQQLEIYYQLLAEWNTKINLTGIIEKTQVYLKHFYDSLTLCKVIDLKNESSLCDVGSGAGFPGLVLKIAFPNLKVTLVDSLKKRIDFLNEVIRKLKLSDIEAVHCRIEEFSRIHREKYDVVTARAVASLPILIEYCIPLVKVNKYFIPLKANVKEELTQSKQAISLLGISLKDECFFFLPKEKSYRTILKFQKDVITKEKFPRKYSEIIKRPL